LLLLYEDTELSRVFGLRFETELLGIVVPNLSILIPDDNEYRKQVR